VKATHKLKLDGFDKAPPQEKYVCDFSHNILVIWNQIKSKLKEAQMTTKKHHHLKEKIRKLSSNSF